jgi:hypothetical protein
MQRTERLTKNSCAEQFFLSIPAWIYQLMTPRWMRTRKFADPRAMLTVDALFIIIWLSAFASQAAYNSSGKCKGACGISKGIVALGVLVTYVGPLRFPQSCHFR